MINDKTKTYEEYQEELVKILEVLNKYNEDILNEVEPAITEEEYNELQERYMLLSEKISIPEEEPEIETRTSWINKVHPLVFIIGVVSIVATNYWLTTVVGSAILQKMLASLEEFTEDKVTTYAIISALIYPVAIILFDTIFLFVFRRPESKKMYRIFYFIVLALVVIIAAINVIMVMKAVKGTFA